MADEVLRGACDSGSSIDKMYLDDYTIGPIAEVCDHTAERQDTRSDDDFPALLERFMDADVVVIASPVYWFGLSAQSKCFIDRLSSYFNRAPYAQRFDGKGYIVLCAYGRPEKINAESVTEPMKLTVQRLRGHYLGDVCAANTYQKGKIIEYPDILESCHQIGCEAFERLVKARSRRDKHWL